jgi:hypothetical protein
VSLSDSSSTVKRSLLAAIVALGLIQGVPATAGTPCVAPGTVLFGIAGGKPIAFTPNGMPYEIPLMGDLEWRAWVGRQSLAPPGPPRWSVERVASDRAVTVRIVDTLDGQVVVQASFAKRIELAASAVAPDGRYALYLQGNNVASELTILDARNGTRRTVFLPHNAELAPFAITFAFAPSMECVAISLERVFGRGPETWLVDIASGATRQLDLDGLTVERWVGASG